MFTACMGHFPAVPSLPIAAVAPVAWTCCTVLLGCFGGRAVGERPLLALAVALTIAFGANVLVEPPRKLRR